MILLNALFYNKTYQHLPEIGTNIFMWLQKLPITYLYVLRKYYQTGQIEDVLRYPNYGFPTQYYFDQILNEITCVN